MLVGPLAEENIQEKISTYKLEYVAVKASSILEKKSSKRVGFTSLTLRILATGSVLYFALRSYEQKRLYLSTNPRLLLEHVSNLLSSPPSSLAQTQSGFWKGFAIATAASTTLFGTVGYYIQRALEVNKEFTIFPPRQKSKYRIYRTKPIVGPPPVLHPREYRKFPLAKKEKISPNVYRFTFALPEKNSILGLPIGQHVAIRAGIDGQSVIRSYTPTSNDSDIGILELVIKVYPNGLLTNYLAKLNVGDEVEFRGPKGAMKYHKDLCKHIGMIAGGTGITPMYQLIRAICEDPEDHTKVFLLYANQTVDDILMHEELENFAKKCPEKFSVHYVVNTAPEGWQYSTGFVTKELIQEKFAPASPESKAMLCGPPGMIKAMKNNLVDLGFEKPGALSKATDQVFTF